MIFNEELNDLQIKARRLENSKRVASLKRLSKRLEKVRTSLYKDITYYSLLTAWCTAFSVISLENKNLIPAMALTGIDIFGVINLGTDFHYLNETNASLARINSIKQ